MFEAQTLAQEKYTNYKHSGVEWLYCIPSHWRVVRFKFLSSITTGSKNTEDKVDTGIYPFYVRSQTPELINSYSFDGEAILTAGDGAGVGKVYHYVNGRFDFHQRVYKFSDFKNTAGKFLFRYLQSNFFKVATLGEAKSTVDSLRLPLIQDFLVCFPENKAEQASIIEFVDLKSKQIEQTILFKERQIELLKERKQILIQQAVTRGLDSHAPMRDTGLEWIGDIPAHWGMMANRALFRERVEPGREDLPLLSVSIHSGVSEEEISEEENIRGRVKIEDKSKYICVRPGDIAFNMMRAWQGAIGAVRVDGMVSPAYTIAVPRPGLDARYFEYQYRTPGFIQQMDRYSKGITDFRKRLYWDGFKQLITLVPPIEEQHAIVEFIEQAMLKQNATVTLLEQQITKLIEYKATLINSAVTGKIKVPGVVEPDTQDRELA
ncbi:restriction endonuclease subunit S [Pseudomonas typographi]|uniref:restriction endonuclease subunit S n=1 Tax=Pseudomonas typographi TaxID=2715964 RepID=UPI0016881333|nr:restriction endonuclease subunit S [Pseudomonas typographi]MBD1555076.1 restriction endonuclease subunit S [Pseudomonas typographi]